MSKINLGRVLLGGFVAGLVLNIGETLLNLVVLGKQLEAELNRLRVPQPDNIFIAKAIVLTFLLGFVIMLTYALIRPRLGAGPKAAVVAGLIAWFGIYFYMGLFIMMLFGFPLNLTLIGFVWGLVEFSLAAIAGAWLYKES